MGFFIRFYSYLEEVLEFLDTLSNMTISSLFLNLKFILFRIKYLYSESDYSQDSDFNEFAAENDNLTTEGRDYLAVDILFNKSEGVSKLEDYKEKKEEDEEHEEDVVDDESDLGYGCFSKV